MSKIILKKVDDPEELKALKRLRYKVYCKELHWLEPSEYPDKMESDEHDAYSLHFGAFKEKKAVGYVRLILKNPLGFPIQKILKKEIVVKFKNKAVAEISRLIVDKNSDLKNYNEIMLALIKEVYYTSKYQEGITHWLAAFDVYVYRLIRMLGFRFNSLEDPVFFMGSKSVPAVLVRSELDEYLKKNKIKLYKYLNSPHQIAP